MKLSFVIPCYRSENTITAVVEEIRETPLIVPCDQKFTERRLAQMNMVKNVQCERILGFDAKWEF